ncbi:MAG: FMN reductase [Candidatus Firestonebacteria bacterium RIFOXYC2_FULL_39_67]|nr:MAG: FMN reductase [Candidatus Firestonebacteria bacterium RIFOXYD2_FULL_39_29]OGF55279.1 MAG: FMN reductase [Candidatus Firestonebacteria bacterium RIFOXYC2_FULL_39_67]
MKVVAFNGSARKDGNTAILIKQVFSVLEKEGIKTELVQLAGHNLKGCVGCWKCTVNKDKKCAETGDIVNDCIAKMIEANGIILGSPTYFADCTVSIKALIERAGVVGMANNELLKHKVGAAVVSVRRGGAIHAFDSINHFFEVRQMFLVGSSYWNIGVGKDSGDVEKDEEGFRTMINLGANMAWLLKKIHAK